MFETINVRLSRSNPSVQWGFKLHEIRKKKLVILSVEPDSLAEKAGIQQNDQIQELFGSALAKGNLWSEIAQRLQIANEINMVLKRCVNDSVQIPWGLRENKNSQEVIVEHWDKCGRVVGHTDQNTKGYMHSFKTEHVDDQPLSNTFSDNLSTQFSKLDPPFSKSDKKHSHSRWDKEEGNVKKHFQSTEISSRLNSFNIPSKESHFVNKNLAYNPKQDDLLREGSLPVADPVAFINIQSQKHPQNKQCIRTAKNQRSCERAVNNSFQYCQTNNFEENPNAVYMQSNPSYNYQRSPNPSVNLLDCSKPQKVDTSQWYDSNQYANPTQYRQRTDAALNRPRNTTASRISNVSSNGYRSQSAAPYIGPRMYYQRNSPRTYRELSPAATIQHLLHKSSLKIFSPDCQMASS